jgi:outer membrane lipoprotein SlyB
LFKNGIKLYFKQLRQILDWRNMVKKEKVSWVEARNATLHCLTGCAIGEILGLIIGTGLGLSNLATVILAISLAFIFGYALTIRSVMKTGVILVSL